MLIWFLVGLHVEVRGNHVTLYGMAVLGGEEKSVVRLSSFPIPCIPDADAVPGRHKYVVSS